jgi:hypothetical protein
MLNILHKIISRIKNLLNQIPYFKKREEEKKLAKIFRYCAYAVVTLIALFVFSFLIQLWRAATIYGEVLNGKDQITYALTMAQGDNFKEAVAYAELAHGNFNQAAEKARGIRNSFFVWPFPFFYSQIDNVVYLFNTTDLLSNGVLEVAKFGKSLEDLLDGKKISGERETNLARFTPEEKKKIIGHISESEKNLTSMKNDIDEAANNLNKVKYNGIFFLFQNKIESLKAKVVMGQDLLTKTIPMARILPAISGYPEKSDYLVMFQNNDELRPTGGFLGTYGILEMEYGDIMRFDTHDIYHMDMPIQSKLNIIPPTPLKLYLNNKWYMRDANWSPDWETSAQQIEWFYKTENKLLPPKNQINKFDGEFAGVIGITPKFVTDLLAITGPVEVEGVQYDQNNFSKLLEYRVEKGYVQLGVSSWQRKEVISEVCKKLKEKLFELPVARWREVVNTIDSNIQSKHIVVYLKDEKIQNMVKAEGWAGDIKNPQGDYLMVVDANLGAYKTDAVVERAINYNVENTAKGLVARVSLNYAHHGGVDWRTTTYKTYTRIYVPLGSKIIKATGFTRGGLDVTENELGKTVFGGFIAIPPGGMGSLYFEYQLPNDIISKGSDGAYKLLVEKQPGNDVNNLKVNIKLPSDKINSFSPTGFYANQKNEQEIEWDTNLLTDRAFEVK